MQTISTLISPPFLEPLRAALLQLGIQGMTIADSRTVNSATDLIRLPHPPYFDSAASNTAKTRIEIAIPSGGLDAVIETLKNALPAAEWDDAQLFVTRLEQVTRVRTGEHAEDAL